MLSLWCLFSKWFVGNRQHSTNQQARWQATDRRRFHSHYSPHSHVTNYSLTMGGLATFVGLVSPHLLLTHYGRTSYLVGLISPHLLLTHYGQTSYLVGLISPHLLLTHCGRTSYIVGLINPHLLLTHYGQTSYLVGLISPHLLLTHYGQTSYLVGLISPHLLLTHCGQTSYLVGLISPHLLLTPLSSCGLSARLWCGNTLHHCLTLFLPSFHRCKNVFTFVYNNSLYFLFFQRFLLWTLWQQQCKHINTITNKNVFYIIHSFDK